jgi:mono/diheme cytochrome c family protein
MMISRVLRGAAVVAVVTVMACRGRSAGGAPTPSGANAMAMPADVTPANIALGDSIFNTGSCARCHGAKGIGAANAPALNDAQWLQLRTGAYDEIVGIITTGVPAAAIKDSTHKTPMGARGGRMSLTDTQIKAVAAYVYSISRR